MKSRRGQIYVYILTVGQGDPFVPPFLQKGDTKTKILTLRDLSSRLFLLFLGGGLRRFRDDRISGGSPCVESATIFAALMMLNDLSL